VAAAADSAAAITVAEAAIAVRAATTAARVRLAAKAAGAAVVARATAIRNEKRRLRAAFLFLAKPRASKIFSIACGSCPDLRSIPMLGEIAGEIWFNDADPAALEFARSMLRDVDDRLWVVRGNALSVARGIRTQFDLVMAGGLFDYLDDRVATLLIHLVVERLEKRGGVFFLTNIAKGNPYRPLIEYFGNWFLIERSDADILRICEAAGLRADQVSIRLESSGLTYIIEIGI
jgi:hypothetical protein